MDLSLIEFTGSALNLIHSRRMIGFEFVLNPIGLMYRESVRAEACRSFNNRSNRVFLCVSYWL